nr:CRISPR-associated protein Csx20 [uncultured Desulfobulbus sp.]
MKKLFLIFNHVFTLSQQDNARHELGVGTIVELPLELRERWANIPPEEPGLWLWLQPLCDWLADHAHPGDYVLVQGDFGACYLLVRFARKHGLIPVYSTTERHAHEERLSDGRVKLTHTFEHVRFRRYGE